MTTHFTFDDRETALFAAFRARSADRADVSAVSRRLDMGDVFVERRGPDGNREGPVVVVERKQVSDLMGSLFDGRLSEQCSRMRQWQTENEGEAPWTVMVIEGVASPFVFRTCADPERKFKHFIKTYLQLAVDAHPTERRLVMRTSSETETAALLLTLQKTIGALKAEGGDGATLAPAGLPRKRHGDVFVSQLACTRGISARRAAQVRAHFSSVSELLRELQSSPAQTRERLAAAVGSRKVGDRLCEDLGANPSPATR